MRACVIRERFNSEFYVASMNDDSVNESTGETASNDATLQTLLQLLVNHTVQGSTTNNAYQIIQICPSLLETSMVSVKLVVKLKLG